MPGEKGRGLLFIQPQGIPIVQSLMICTQTQQQLSLRDPVRGRGNPFSRPLPPWRESRGKPSEGFPVYYIRFLFAGEPPAGRFLCRQRKRRKKPPKGTYFEAVPFGIPPRRRRGLRPRRSPTGDGGTGDRGRGTGERGRGLRIATTSDIGHWFRNDTFLLFGALPIR